MFYETRLVPSEWHGELVGCEELVLPEAKRGPCVIRVPRIILAEVASQSPESTVKLRQCIAQRYGPQSAYLSTPYLLKELGKEQSAPADWWVLVPDWWPPVLSTQH